MSDKAAINENGTTVRIAGEAGKNKGIGARIVEMRHPSRVLDVRQPVHWRGDGLHADRFRKGRNVVCRSEV